VEIRFGETAHDLDGAHVAFIAGKLSSREQALLAAAHGKHVLTVGESPEFLEQGGMIRFLTDRHHVRFEIDEKTARAEGLRISSKLLRLGASRG
jgi:hypothetical protein